MSKFRAAVRSLMLGALACAAVACGGSGGGSSAPPLAAAGTAYATTATNDLITFDVDAPGVLLSSVPITGLQVGETINGLDLRSGTGELLALGTAGRLYRINPSTAVATEFGAAPFLPLFLLGTSFGFDVDPDTDQIRVVTDADENARASAATGAFIASDSPPNLAYAVTDVNNGQNPNVVGLAYSADAAGSTTATAYGIDSNLDILVQVGGLGGAPSPSAGTLFTVGTLGVTTGSTVAFDIAQGSGRAFAALSGAASSFYRIDLGTGSATFVGAIGAVPTTVTGLAVVSEQAPTLLALTTVGNLITFRADAPGTILASVAVTGIVAPGESLVGIDVRPATGQLYGVTASRLYRIDATTGVASAVSPPAAFGLLTAVGIDFNPVADALRVVTDSEQNLRINPNDGTVLGTDTPLQYAVGDPNAAANPNVVGSAYTNSSPGATATALFGIDSNLDIVVRQNPPNAGTLTTVGSLGFDTTALVGFDVVAGTGDAFASLTASLSASSVLYRVSLGTGAASAVGTIGGGSTVVGLTVVSAAAATGPTTLLIVDNASNLYRVDAANPSVALAGPIAITGLALGELVHGIDARPATGQVFLLGSTSRIYTLDPATGVATVVGAPLAFTLAGTSFGFDFNPITDEMRITSDTEQNIRVTVTGTLAGTDTALAYAVGDPNFGQGPTIVASGYTGVTGSSATTLYDIDAGLNILVIQTPPNAGTLTTVGGLGVALLPGSPVGSDIAPTGGRSYVSAILTAETATRLFVVNLTTGALTNVGLLPGVSPVRGVAVER